MTTLPKITSTGALLDVKRGRKALEKHFAKRPRTGECPDDLRIPVIIHGYIDYQWGRDDGESTEFAVTVEKVEVGGQP